MGMRFRRSIKIAPGVKANIGKKSAGVSVGGKYGGLSANSKTGIRGRMSIPGTGISYSKSLSSQQNKKQRNLSNNSIAFTTAFDEKTIRTLNDKAFTAYMQEYSSYARDAAKNASAEELEEIEHTIAIIQSDYIRRQKNAEEQINAEKEPSIKHLICGTICAISGIIISLFTLWGLIFVTFGIILLITELKK